MSIEDLIDVEFDVQGGGRARVTGPGPAPGYVDIEITYPDGTTGVSCRVVSQLRLGRLTRPSREVPEDG